MSDQVEVNRTGPGSQKSQRKPAGAGPGTNNDIKIQLEQDWVQDNVTDNKQDPESVQNNMKDSQPGPELG